MQATLMLTVTDTSLYKVRRSLCNWCTFLSPSSPRTVKMAKRILFIFTSNDRLVNTSTKTGWYLPEAAHPYYGLIEKGIAVDFVSEAGGRPPLDPQSIHIADNDSISKKVRRVIQSDTLTAS